MKNSDFWFLSLCVLLMIAGVNGWSIPIRIGVAANAVVVLMDVARSAKALFKNSKEGKQ